VSAETCSSCGAAYKPNAAFCSACGTRRTLDEPSRFLRHRSQSLWPSMLAHCLHNVGVIVVGHLG
jgi:hypothetical protein